MKLVFIQIAFFFVVAFSYGQYSGERADNYNSDYNRARREVQKDYDKQADLNRQPNSPSGGIVQFMTQAEMDALEDQLRKSAGRISLAEEKEARKKIEERRKKEYEEYSKKVAIWKAKYDAEFEKEKEDRKPTVDKFIADGFYPGEAESMSYTKKWNTDEARFFNANVIYSKRHIDFLKENIKTEAFENLEFRIYDLIKVDAVVTAFDFMQKLEYRFPEKQFELYRLKLAIYVKFFKEYGYKSCFGNNYEGKMKQIIDSYMVLEESNPELFMDFDQATDGMYFFGPYQKIDNHYDNILNCRQCDDKAKKKFAKKEKERYALRYTKMKSLFPNCICEGK